MTKSILLRKKDVVKSFIRWQWAHITNYNYERMQACGVLWALTPVIRRLYNDDKEAFKDAMQRHLQFFNTEPSFGGPIISTVIAMEEQKANGADIKDEMIDSFKTGLMGPLAGVGDTLWQGTIIPILLSITIPFAAQGNIIMGPVAFFVIYETVMIGIAYYLWMLGYNKGRAGIIKIMRGSLLKKVMIFCQTLGPIVMGALTAGFVVVSTPVEIQLSSGNFMSVQKNIFDQLLPGFLPLVITLLTYYAFKRRVSTNKVLLIMMIAGCILSFFGLIKN